MTPENEIVLGYKATDKDMKCRGKQYAVGETYEHDGEISLCREGLHFCQNPLDVLDFYDLCDSEFLSVEAHGKCESDDKKTVTNKLKVTASIGLPGLIKASVDWIFSQTKKSKTKDSSKLAASGYSSKLAASGYSSQLAASGDSSKLAASGDYSKLAASGDSSKLAASGYSSKLAASGDSSIAAGIGINNIAKAKKGNWIVLAEWKYSDELSRWIPVCVLSAQVDGKIIKEDMYYRVFKGKLVEA